MLQKSAPPLVEASEPLTRRADEVVASPSFEEAQRSRVLPAPVPEETRNQRFGGPTRGGANFRNTVLDYLQQIELKETVAIDGSVTVELRRGALRKSRTFALDVDYQLFGARSSGMISAPVVFVGYGISEQEIGFDEYDGVDARGKIVMMFDGVPRREDPGSVLSPRPSPPGGP